MEPIYKLDSWLAPYASIIDNRHQKVLNRLEEIKSDFGSLREFASAYKYYGLHREGGEWIMREWAPNATGIVLLCDQNGWHDNGD